MNLQEISANLSCLRSQIADALGGRTTMETFAAETFIRQTNMIGFSSSESNRQETWPSLDHLKHQVFNRQLESLELKAVKYLTGYHFGCLQFAFKNGEESPKYGDNCQVKNVYELRESPVVKLTVHKNNLYIVGLKFTYLDEQTDEFMGKNGGSAEQGPIHSVDFNLCEGEKIIGVTVEQCAGYPRRIGFTILKTE